MPPKTSDTLRWAVPSDAPALADVQIGSWRRAYSQIFPEEFLAGLDHRRRTEWWRRFIVDGARVHVAGDDQVVGFCHADESRDVSGWGEVFSIYVQPEHWGRGLGHELLLAAEANLAWKGFDRALLWVVEANERARDFYERHGWSLGAPFRVEEIGGVQVTEVRYEKSLSGDAVSQTDPRDR